MTQAQQRSARICELVNQALSPRKINVVDDSHKHAGHAGARNGGGHFTLLVVADCFEGVPLLGRHRMIYDVLKEQLGGSIHALSIRAYSPDEYSALDQ